MKRGPRPAPTNLRVLRGNPGRRPIHPEPQPTLGEKAPEAPSFLVNYACDEWYRIVEELHRLQLVTLVDINALAAYCQAYSIWRTATEALDKIAANDPVMHGLMIKRDNAAIANPLISIARKAALDMVRFASEFGLTPAARARIGGDTGEPEQSKFRGLLRLV